MGCSASIPQADAKSTTTSGVVDFSWSSAPFLKRTQRPMRESWQDGVDVALLGRPRLARWAIPEHR